MKTTVDYWSSFYEEENIAVPFVDLVVRSGNVQLPKIPETSVSYQPQASSSTSARPQDSPFNFQFQPTHSDMNIETSLAGWQGSNGDGSNQTSGATFHVQIKLRDPPASHGRATDDMVTWLCKVEDFFYLTRANPKQQVAYTATLLLDAAADWWTGLLKENGGQRPRSFQILSTLLKQRFQSSTRVDKVRAELWFVKQGDKELIHAYSCKFTALLQKLPSYDVDWAISQYIWGLSPNTVELVMMNRPATLATALQRANDIELAH